MAENGKDDPGSHCLPTGIVKLHTAALLKKIIQTPGLLVILNERNMNFRQIFTEKRRFPPIRTRPGMDTRPASGSGIP